MTRMNFLRLDKTLPLIKHSHCFMMSHRIIAALLVFFVHLLSHAQNFSPPINYYSTNSDTIGMFVLADVNGDGKPDLICNDDFSSNITVLLNDGNGGFFSNYTYSVGGVTRCVAVGDFRHSGKPDLITANFSSGEGKTLSMLTNDGTGRFALSATYNVDNAPFWVVAADTRGSGNLDVVVLNGNNLTVLTNNGIGLFSFDTNYTVAGSSLSFAAADVNGDGKIDLVCATLGAPPGVAGSATILTNNGASRFHLSQTLGAGVYPKFLTVADIDGDGSPDIICANSYNFSRTLTILTNNGRGMFGSNATYTVGIFPSCVVAADLRKSGNNDLISVDDAGLSMTILTNTGKGSFGLCQTLKLPLQPLFAAAVDLNGDGQLDLLCANHWNVVSKFINVPSLVCHSSSVTWPSTWTNWILQQSSCLDSTNWSICSDVSDDGTNKIYSVNPALGNNFFRLFHP